MGVATSAGPVDPPNVMVNYATKDSNTPLSPIWGMMQLQKIESDTSSGERGGGRGGEGRRGGGRGREETKGRR